MRGLHKYYDLQHELGKGAFATVMKALHKEEGKWYAVKMIQNSKLRKGVNGEEKRNRSTKIAREINILERVRHRNICQMKEVFYEEYNISKYSITDSSNILAECLLDIVLEWVPGGNLLDYILKKNGISEYQRAVTSSVLANVIQRNLRLSTSPIRFATRSL